MRGGPLATGGRRSALLLVAVIVGACGDGNADAREASGAGDVAAAPAPGDSMVDRPEAVRPAATEAWPTAADSIPGTPWTRRDWEIFEQTIRTADDEGLDTLPLGEAVAEMGRLFLGSPYVPRTLEVPGPERLVVNLRGLDCVTFVENVLALTRFSRMYGPAVLDDPARARHLYEADLATLRYRNAAPDGYASRIHYFSEWLQRSDRDGRVRLLRDLPGVTEDEETIDFMSTHAEAYDQLADAGTLARIRTVEGALNRSPRPWIPEGRIPEAASGIRTGDVIAATSTVQGLDVAHTGIAIWVDGRLHLLHAPLVGSTVVLSERPLAERIMAIGSQDGIMVARPGGAWWEVR